MEFRSERDYELCAKVRGENPLLQSLEFRSSTELHMTNDNHFFRKLAGKKAAAGQMLLYEGKMIHQFDAAIMPSWKRKCARNLPAKRNLPAGEISSRSETKKT